MGTSQAPGSLKAAPKGGGLFIYGSLPQPCLVLLRGREQAALGTNLSVSCPPSLHPRGGRSSVSSGETRVASSGITFEEGVHEEVGMSRLRDFPGIEFEPCLRKGREGWGEDFYRRNQRQNVRHKAHDGGRRQGLHAQVR